MNWFQKLQIRQKIATSTFFVLVLITIVAWSSIQWIIFPYLTHEITRRGTNIAQSIANRGHSLITNDDRLNLLDLIFTEKRMERYLAYVFVLDSANNVMVHTFLEPLPISLAGINLLAPDHAQNTSLVNTPYGPVYDTAMGVYVGMHRIATVRVGLSKAYVDRVMNRLISIFLAVLAFIAVLAVFLTTWFSRQITGPIHRLTRIADEAGRGNLDAASGLAKKVQCWLMREGEHEGCPANEHGKLPCWFVDKTRCHGAPKQVFPHKLEDCHACDVYKAHVGDEIDQLSDTFYHMVHNIGLYQDRLKQSNEDLRRLNASYMNMLRFVSHELKTPVANSSMSARALLQGVFGDLTPVQEKMVGLICQNLEQSLGMVKNYLDLSRIEQDELRFRPARVRLVEDIVQPVLSNIATLIDSRGMRIENLIDDELALEADAELLKVVYTNLLSNACKYGYKGGLIRLRAEDLGSAYRLEVWNEGPGVPAEKMEQLFQKFSRIQGPEPVDSKGTGLGLFICRNIVERHKGSIHAESVEGKSMNIILEIPKAREEGVERQRV